MKLSPNEVTSELKRVETGNFGHFVKKVILRNVRGFSEQYLDFRYPVTGLIGTNGGGKSTILGATALAYKNVKPGQFFPKASVGDNSMSEWSIEYELIDKQNYPNRNLMRTARFAQAKWRRSDFPDRNVEYIEIQRTVPAGELSKYKRFIAANPNAIDSEWLPEDTIRFASAVLDKDVSNYQLYRIRNFPEHTLYGGFYNDVGYSQFHFGAGEASIIATIDRIEKSSTNSLVLIEEVENGLHPVAVRLFVNYLENAAKRKRLQIVFTTHSQDAVDQLPSEAIWATINKKTFNGKLTIEGLRAVTGNISNTRVIFVEDRFAKEWVENALGRYGGDLNETTKVYEGGGYPNLITVCQYHNENPSISVPAVALVDGDQYDPQASIPLPEFAFYLGGGVPETTVFDYIYENRSDLSAIIQQRCLLARFSQEEIVGQIESVRNSACDPHEVFERLGVKLGFSSAIRIRDGMIDVYNEKNETVWKGVIEFLNS